MPSVFVIPVYVEVPGGFERAVLTLDDLLRRFGYKFRIAEPITGTLEETEPTRAENVLKKSTQYGQETSS
jgi:hypothetical protein